jgi:hypothetical protein
LISWRAAWLGSALVTRIAARLLPILLVLCAGCGGGGDADATHAGVEAFPDVLEIARAELGEDAALHEVAVAESRISFVQARFGRNTRVTYNTNAVFVGNQPVRKRLDPARVFGISNVPTDAPAKLLAGIQERENGDVTGFEATLMRARDGTLVWNAKATAGGSAKRYEADVDGTLRD